MDYFIFDQKSQCAMSTKRHNRKGRGFTGERMIGILKEVIEKCRTMPLINKLFTTQMGFFPKDLLHYYQRPTGMSQVILIYCPDALGWVQVPNRRVKLPAGDMYAIAPGVPHSYGADTDNPWTIYWFHSNGTDCDESAWVATGDRKNLTQFVRVIYSDERIVHFDGIFATFLNGYSQSNLLFANLTLPYFLASFVLPDIFQPKPKASSLVNPINKAIHFMQDNLSAPITLDNIAQWVHLSTSFFSRKFKQHTGYAPIEYFNHPLIQKACQLLHFSDLGINEVASTLGIGDPFYFSRLFKKQMSLSPIEYRKREGATLRRED